MVTSLRRLGALAVSLVLVAACSGDTTSAPSSPLAAPAGAPSANRLGGPTLLGGGPRTIANNFIRVAGLQRSSPLAASITVTKTIGSSGGTLSIPHVGVTVTFPIGALSSPTVITMTARAGSLLAYDFAPHGITFAKPLVITQRLAGTNALVLNAKLLELGYYSDPSQLNGTGGLVSELISGTVNLVNRTFTSSITHFSGYMVACGRGAEE